MSSSAGLVRVLMPLPATASARPHGRAGAWLGFGLTRRALWLVVAGLVFVVGAFWLPALRWAALAWDLLVLTAVAWEVVRLPRAQSFTVSREFLESPQMGSATRLRLRVQARSDQLLRVVLIDDLHPALAGTPLQAVVELFGTEAASALLTVWPEQRGNFALGDVYLRYGGALQLAERWAVATPVEDEAGTHQKVRVYPVHTRTRGENSLLLIRARQMERQRRQQRLRGSGREFESMREFQPGDELRAVSWTATARRGRVVTRQFMAERSQQVWAVLDAGRLSRTALEVRRGEAPVFAGETEAERERAHRLTVTVLDQAATAASFLAQVATQSGDKFAMLSYGTSVQQVLLPAAGPQHLRSLLDLLSATFGEGAESQPLLAAARLKQLQRRRGLIFWIAELTDAVGTPELVLAATELARRHVVVLVLLRHPELEELAEAVPVDTAEMYSKAAAIEMVERRRGAIRQLEQRGVLIVETTAEEAGVRTVNEYLEVKARGLL